MAFSQCFGARSARLSLALAAVLALSRDARAEDDDDADDDAASDASSPVVAGEASESEPIVLGPVPGAPLRYRRGARRIRPLRDHAPPPGYVVAEGNYRGIWGGGIGAAAGGYLVSTLMTLLVSGFEHDPGLRARGSLPLIGSYFLAAESGDETIAGLAIFTGLVQLGGLGMILGGTLAHHAVWLREDLAKPTTISLDLAPTGGAVTLSF